MPSIIGLEKLYNQINRYLPGFTEDILSGMSDKDMQRKYGSQLKSLAFKHLRSGESPWVKGLPEAIENHRIEKNGKLQIEGDELYDSLDDFLKKQEKLGVTGTYMELYALCDLFGIRPQINSQNHIDRNKANYNLISDLNQKNINKPIIEIYHHEYEVKGNTFLHWSISEDRKKTEGDNNNCLYNSFAQCLRLKCLDYHKEQKQLYDNINSLFSKNNAYTRAIANLNKAEVDHAVSKKAKTRSEETVISESQFRAIQQQKRELDDYHQCNNKELDPDLSETLGKQLEDDNQIADDYAYALKLAVTDLYGTKIKPKGVVGDDKSEVISDDESQHHVKLS
jgi:hypothetical protein